MDHAAMLRPEFAADRMFVGPRPIGPLQAPIGLEPLRLRLSLLAVLVFACGLASPFSLNVVGEVFASELMLIPVTLYALLAGRADRALNLNVFWALILAATVMLCGYVLSDMVRHTSASQYLRGWGRIGLLISDIVCVALLVAGDKRNLWWYCLGTAAGGLFVLVVQQHVPITEWKLGYATPAAYLVLGAVALFGQRWQIVAMLALAALGMVLDARNFSATLIVTAVLIAVRLRAPRAPLSARQALLKLAVPLLIAASVIVAGLAYTGGERQERRDMSNLGRGLGWMLGMAAIVDSPVIGYGSWNDSHEATLQQREIYRRVLGPRIAAQIGDIVFSPHSQVLQSWYEGGVLGFAFFAVYGWTLLTAIWRIGFRLPQTPLSALMLYICLTALWNYFMSPFAGVHRMGISAACAIIVWTAWETRRQRNA